MLFGETTVILLINNSARRRRSSIKFISNKSSKAKIWRNRLLPFQIEDRSAGKFNARPSGKVKLLAFFGAQPLVNQHRIQCRGV
ncbi:MAG: hypothetical protein ACREQX_04195, partial [Candidatus Binataceae bacterium]